MIKPLVLSLISCTILMSCINNTERISEKSVIKPKFKLKSDYLNFSEKLQNGDTLKIQADLSICLSEVYEENLIFRKKGVLYISTTRRVHEDSLVTYLLEPTAINGNCQDTLTFEYFFQKLDRENKVSSKDKTSRFAIFHANDTLRYDSNDLLDAMSINLHYSSIKQCLFPNSSFYKSLFIKAPKPERIDNSN